MSIEDVLPDDTGLVVAVDTETSGLHVDDGCRTSAVSVAWEDPEQGTITAVAFPFDQGTIGKAEGSQGDLLERDENLGESEWKYLIDWLEAQWLVNQNIKFDLHMLRVGTRHFAGRCLEHRVIGDTMLNSKELDPLHPTSLKPTAERLGLMGGGERDEEEAIKSWLKAYAKRTKTRYSDIRGRYDLIPWDVLGPYAAKDAELALRLYLLQVDRIDCGESSWRFVRRELEVMRVLYRMEKRGIGYDAAQSLEIADVLQKRVDKLAKTIPFEPTIPTAKRFFFDQQGVTPYKTTEKGAPQLDDEVVSKMVKDGVPWAEEFQEVRKLQGWISRWYRGYPELIGADGRLRTSFRQAKSAEGKGMLGRGGAVSGRFSSERVNLQAIPHDYRLNLLGDTPSVRSLFRADEGKQLWELDLSQAELRVAARKANAKTMLRYIEEGQDAHGETAKQLFHVEPGTPDWFPKRQVSKRGNFSLIFGVGGPTFHADVRKQTGIDLGRIEAERIVQDWRSIHPEFQRAIYRHSEVAKHKRYLVLANGRPRWFAPHEDTHKAFNQWVQGSIAELVKDWMVAVEQRWPGILVLQIHDSLVLEVTKDRIEENVVRMAAALGKQLAEEMFDVPMEVEYARWGEK